MENSLTLQGLFAEMRTQAEAAGGQNAWARKHGLRPSDVSMIANATRKPNGAVLKALGYKRIERFVPVKVTA